MRADQTQRFLKCLLLSSAVEGVIGSSEQRGEIDFAIRVRGLRPGCDIISTAQRHGSSGAFQGPQERRPAYGPRCTLNRTAGFMGAGRALTTEPVAGVSNFTQ